MPPIDTIQSSCDSIITADTTELALSNSVFARRTASRWSQAELAKRAGISRPAVSAIESGRLTPSVTAALALARALSCSVEELFIGKPNCAPQVPTWAWEPWGTESGYWDAEVCGRHFHYPVESLTFNAEPQDGVSQAGVLRQTRSECPDRTLVVATCDPAAGLLARTYARESGFRMLVFPRNGSAALKLAEKRLIHVAAIHRTTAEFPERNAESARKTLGPNARLLHVAGWQSGLAIAATNRTRSVRQLKTKVQQWAAREPGSAAREVLETLLEGKKPTGRVVDGHFGVSEAVRAGWAEAGICAKISAVEARLNFLPIQTESLEFCFLSSLERDPRIQALIRVLRSQRYRQMISELPGYDAKFTGDITTT